MKLKLVMKTLLSLLIAGNLSAEAAFLPATAPPDSIPAALQTSAAEASGIASPYDLPPETYNTLLNDLLHVGKNPAPVDQKVHLSGEMRYHYSLNSGSNRWERVDSGLRMYLGADAALDRNWRVHIMTEGHKDIKNYDDRFDLTRYYIAGKTGETWLKAGKFGYLMADGNIYDSGFTGVRADFGKVVKYTVAYGDTNDTKNTLAATLRYSDFDYTLEAGAYHYRQNDGTGSSNTIWTLSETYHFSNFSVGAMVLSASRPDTHGNNAGYVLSFNYGDLKSWRPHTYSFFAKYYNQPRHTYLAHSMNGIGSRLEGFTGYGLGADYTLKENLTAGIEYYRLSGKISVEKADTLWLHLTHYF